MGTLGFVRIVNFCVVLELVIGYNLLFIHLLWKCGPPYLKHGPGYLAYFTFGAWKSANE